MERLGPWAIGVVNSMPAARIPPNALLSAVDVDIDRTGTISRRRGWQRLSTTPAHSLFEHEGKTYGVLGGNLGELHETGFTVIGPVTGKLAWTVVNNEPVFADAGGVSVIRSGQVKKFAEDIGPGEEDLLLTPMPGGSHLAYWQGRLLVARGNTIFYSEPLRYGLYSPARNFIQFPERVYWLAALPTGIWVGLRNTVRLLAGTSPQELTQRVVGGPSWQGACAVLNAEQLDPKTAERSDQVVVWMTSSGLAIGTLAGEVIRPHLDSLADVPLGKGAMAVSPDRITILST